MAVNPFGSLTQSRTKSSHFSPSTGLCTICDGDCGSSCEVAYSAIRSTEALYPFRPDRNQFGSDKQYPIDFSNFQINGRVFGSSGNYGKKESPSYYDVDCSAVFGKKNEVVLTAPLILPAMAKLNWADYFTGAAVFGIPAVIGEDVVAKDPSLVLKKGSVLSSPLIAQMVQMYRTFYRGYGDIVLQANADDESLGVLDYAISELGVESVELKFGQGAKGIQGVSRISSIEEALRFQKMGYLVYPDPSDPKVERGFSNKTISFFERVGKLPFWAEEDLVRRIEQLRSLGAKRICFKTGPFSPADLIRITKLASTQEVDLITYDSIEGGTGNSPVRMMSEWGSPTVYLESAVYQIAKSLSQKGVELPQLAIAGGIAFEDQVFKVLSLGAPYVQFVGIGRGAMAAAMAGKRFEEDLKNGVPGKRYTSFGLDKESLFINYRYLQSLYGRESVSCGAVALYSYLEKTVIGLKQFLALNRKFALSCISREDIFSLTQEGSELTGIRSYSKLIEEQLEE